MWEKLKEMKKWVVEKVLWAETELKGKTGAEKRAVVVAKLNEIIDLPWVPEWVEGYAIGWLVDFVCDMLNRLFGHDWRGVNPDEEHTERLAEALDAPVAVVSAVAEKEGLSVDERIDALYKEYRIEAGEVPAPESDEQWTEHFAKSEFACKCGCGEFDMDPDIVKMCETIRTEIDMPLRVNSGRRCKKHNASLPNSAKDSYHCYGKAVDLSCALSPRKLFETVKRLYEAGKLPGLAWCKEYSWGVHIDTGKTRKQRFVPRG